MVHPRLSDSELILTADKRIYHLDLRNEDIAETIFLVGDPGRVGLVSQCFDRVEMTRQHREFITHTGYIGKRRVSVVSTGISTANIDIILNELDALVNIDFETRQVKSTLTQLNIIRIGTAGSLQADIPVDSFVATSMSIGMGSLLSFYPKPYTPQEESVRDALERHLHLERHHVPTTVSAASEHLLNKFAKNCILGMTVTCPGFYAPQGRFLRAPAVLPNIINDLASFEFEGRRICNLEMETSAIYGIGQVLNHHYLSLSAILADRITGRFTNQAQKSVMRLIEIALGNVTNSPLPKAGTQKTVIPNFPLLHCVLDQAK